MMKENKKKEKLIDSLYAGELAKKYRGKHVVIVGNKIHPIPYDEEKADKLFERLEKKFPQETPTLLFVPKEDSYIL